MTTKTQETKRSFNGDRSYLWDGNYYPLNDAPVRTVVTFGRTRTGVANPKWKTQVRDDVNASTVFTAQESSGVGTYVEGQISYDEFYLNQRWVSTVKRFEGYSPNVNIPSSRISHYPLTPSIAEADAIAIRNLHRQIDRLNHQFQGGVFVGQFKQAVKMVLSPVKSLRTKLSDYINVLSKRRRGVKPEKLRKVLADTYLEYTFGWQPLLSDVKDAVKVFNRIAGNTSERKRFRVKGEQDKQLSQTQIQRGITFNNQFPLTFQQTVLVKANIKVVYYGLFKGGILDPDRAATQSEKVISLCGFDFASFLPTAWELLPWSFLIDYFTNIGDMISAYTHQTSQVKWLTKVTVITSEEDIRSVFDAASTQNWMTTFLTPSSRFRNIRCEGVDARSKSTFRSVTRSPTTVPFPTLQFETPALDSLKWLNIAALALGARPKTPFYKGN